MDITYEIKSKHLLSKSELNQLDYLHYRDGRCWSFLKNKFKLGIVILAKENNQDIVSWGLVFERSNCDVVLYIYTKKSHRRLGLGTKIYELTIKNFGENIDVSRHNSVSKAFWDKIGVK